MPRMNYGRVAVVVVLVVVLYYVVRIVEPFFSGLVWAAIIASVFNPLYNRLIKSLKRPRLASFLTCIVITGAIIVPILLLVFQVAGESAKAYNLLEQKLKAGGGDSFAALRNSAAYQWLLIRLQDLGLPEPDLTATAIKALRAVSEFLVGHSASIVSSFTHFVLNFVVMLFALYYLFQYGPGILSELRVLSPLRGEHQDLIVEKFRDIARATFLGTLAVAAIQGTAGGLVFLFFGLPSPLLWGAVMAFLSLVPVVGTALVWAPVAGYYLLTGAVWKGLVLIVLFVGFVGMIDNIVKPILIKRGTEIHTLWVFLSILGGVGVFGFLGFVLGPFMVTVFFTLIEIYKVEFSEELAKKATSEQTV